jgi:hypothetical protein
MANGMKVEIQKGELIIRIPVQKPTISKGGKMMQVASSGGFQETTAEVDGSPLFINLYAGIKR